MHFTHRALTLAAAASLAVTGIVSAADTTPVKEPAVTTAPQAPAPSVEKPTAVKTDSTASKPSDVVAKVNGTDITRAELDRTVQMLLAQNRMQAPTDPADKKKIEEAALNQMVSVELLYQAGKKTEIPDLAKKVDDQMAQWRSRFPTKEDYEKALKGSGLSEQELKDLAQRELIISSYVDKQISTKVKVTTEQAKKFYDENIDKFKRPESVHASHILVGVDPKATAEEKQKAKQKADDLLKQVKAGADFAEVAKKESTCPSSKNGGDLGEFGRGQMVKPFEDAAFSLKPGEMSTVVETQFGYHIIKVTDKQAGSTVPFDEVKGKIEEYLKKSETDKLVMARVEELKKGAKIEYPGMKN